jgi:hypothetical protein
VVSTKTPIRSSDKIFFGAAFVEDESPVIPAPTNAVDLRKSRRLLPDIFPAFHIIFNKSNYYFNFLKRNGYKIIPFSNDLVYMGNA